MRHRPQRAPPQLRQPDPLMLDSPPGRVSNRRPTAWCIWLPSLQASLGDATGRSWA